MSSDLILTLGDTRFVQASSCCVRAYDPVGYYTPFLCPAPASRPWRESVSVGLTADPAPTIPDGTRIFDCRTWHVYGDASRHVLAHPAGDTDDLTWMATLSRGSDALTVTCGEAHCTDRDGETTITTPVCYPLDQFLMMYTLGGFLGVRTPDDRLVEATPGMMVHCAGLSVGGRGLILPGRSGAGKSTLAKLLMQCNEAELLSDDRVILRERPDGIDMVGTPWPGEAGITRNDRVPLHGIVFLEQAPRNAIVPLSPGQAATRLLHVTSIPWYDKAMTSRFLSFIDRLVAQVPSFKLQFTPTPEAAESVMAFMRA